MLTVHIHVRVHRVARAGLVSLVKLQRLPRNGIELFCFFVFLGQGGGGGGGALYINFTV